MGGLGVRLGEGDGSRGVTCLTRITVYRISKGCNVGGGGDYGWGE